MDSATSFKEDGRVLFAAGKQEELVIRAKTEMGFTWGQFADSLEVSEYTLRHDWRNEIYCIPTKKLGRLLSLLPKSVSKNAKRHIVKIYPANWGQRKGGEETVEYHKRRRKVNQPSLGNSLAEFCGIMLGDGCLLNDRIYIYFNSQLDKRYLGYTSELLRNLFGIGIPQKKHGPNCEKIAVYSTELVKFCQKIGLIVGSKTKNQVGIPKWIWEKNSYLKGCVRGLTDTDGGFHRKKDRWGTWPQVSFANRSINLKNDYNEALSWLGINSYNGNKAVFIQSASDIKKYFKIVGSANPRVFVRYAHYLKTKDTPYIKEISGQIEGYSGQLPFMG